MDRDWKNPRELLLLTSVSARGRTSCVWVWEAKALLKTMAPSDFDNAFSLGVVSLTYP